jgi:hypothetical protein
VAGSIANTKTFEGSPSVFMYGMFCAETGAMIWILFATYLELPVSTTHSISEWRLGFWEGCASVGRRGPHAFDTMYSHACCTAWSVHVARHPQPQPDPCRYQSVMSDPPPCACQASNSTLQS